MVIICPASRHTTANVFVDTNVFIYALDEADLKKQEAAQAWRAWLWQTNRGRISFHVLQELYAIATKKQPSARAEIRKEIGDLLTWQPIAVDGNVIARAWKIEDRYRISFWDALIVSAASLAGCGYLLTEDLQHGQDLDTVVVVNPFLREPSSLD